MAAHESPRTTKFYDRTADVITLDESSGFMASRGYVAIASLPAELLQTHFLMGTHRFTAANLYT
jgi:hypothetical protein